MQALLLLSSFLLTSLCLALPSTGQSGFYARDFEPRTVVAHFMVGNTLPYSVSDWMNDIALASSKGIDAFALNVGSDSWEPSKVADAYTAAQNLNTNFKLFMSFDMTSLPCGSSDNVNQLHDYINTYGSHPNQFLYDNKVFVSTFGGEYCNFGTGSLNDGWTSVVRNGVPAVHFVPAFFVDPGQYQSLPVVDGCFHWNGAWPQGNYDTNFDSDDQRVSNLGGRTYMASVSPWFFTHYGPDSYNKNFIYRGDDWLLAERWELLNQHRDSVDIAQILTWNDYGESHYIGPIEGAQPNSQSWTDGYDHQGWLDLVQYYAIAFKTGYYPAIDRDRLFVWARQYPASADAPDRIPRPDHSDWTQDIMWAVVLLTAPADVTLSCGSSSETTSLPAGLSKLQLPLSPGQARGSISRDNIQVLNLDLSGYSFNPNPPNYNFNAFVAASP